MSNASVSCARLSTALTWADPTKRRRGRAVAWLVTAAVLVGASGSAMAQANWVQRQSPTMRSRHAMTYDSARRRVILFGGVNTLPLSDTWEYEGANWVQHVTASSPPKRDYPVLAYDAARARVVLFGGGNFFGPHFSDTWEYDGTTWSQRAPTVSPPARTGHAMAYDAARRRVVLFGGVVVGDLADYPADTWEYDGTTWSQRMPAASPSGRRGHLVACDAARARVVLFGGFDDSSTFNDTWEYDGTSWSPTSAIGPTTSSDSSIAYDSARRLIVLFKGGNPGVTWLYDGSVWRATTTATSPPGGYPDSFALAYDAVRAQVVLFSGIETVGRDHSATWEYDGVDWIARDPPACLLHSLAYDSARRRVVLFGGVGVYGPLSETWEYDGTAWARFRPSTSPSARESAGLAYDAARGRVVLFGGSQGAGNGAILSDTWEYDGVNWTQQALATNPSARCDAGFAYDGARSRVVLFGGTMANRGRGPRYASDTWEYTGVDWVKREPAVSPPGRAGPMVYDAARGVAVLFGGYRDGLAGGTQYFSDTWEYDGTNWAERTPATSPSARFGHVLVYDTAYLRVVLFGGRDAGGAHLSDTWEYDGINWEQRAPVTHPQPSAGAAGAYDMSKQRVVLFGGTDTQYPFGDTWEYEHPPSLFARYWNYGSGCVGSAGVPALGHSGVPRIGTTFLVRCSRARANAPAIYFFGTSSTSWGSVPLPFRLTPFGAPGCAILASGDLTTVMMTSDVGTAAVSFSVPNIGLFIGYTFYNQFLVLDPTANPLGLATSDGGVGVVGSL